MTRYTQVTTPLSPSDSKYGRMRLQRETATTRQLYLRSVVLPWFDRELQPFGYKYTFPVCCTPPIVVRYSDLEIDSLHQPSRYVYAKEFEKSWKLRERGILHALEDMKKFLTVVESPAADNVVRGWRTLFLKLQRGRGANMDRIPCLYFNTDEGCLDPKCRFQHDAAASQAERQKTFDRRRDALDKPTPQQLEDIARQILDERTKEIPRNKAQFEAAMKAIEIKAKKAVAACINPDCGCWSAKKNVLKRCGKCQWAKYCSTACEKQDAKRHVHECRSREAIIEDDSLWADQEGVRRGTEGSYQASYFLRVAGQIKQREQERLKLQKSRPIAQEIGKRQVKGKAPQKVAVSDEDSAEDSDCEDSDETIESS